MANDGRLYIICEEANGITQRTWNGCYRAYVGFTCGSHTFRTQENDFQFHDGVGKPYWNEAMTPVYLDRSATHLTLTVRSFTPKASP